MTSVCLCRPGGAGGFSLGEFVLRSGHSLLAAAPACEASRVRGAINHLLGALAFTGGGVLEGQRGAGRRREGILENKFSVKSLVDFQGIPAGTVGTLVVQDDFRTVTINFINEEGEKINLEIQPEKVTSVFEVIQ